jgi:hypothetical protein
LVVTSVGKPVIIAIFLAPNLLSGLPSFFSSTHNLTDSLDACRPPLNPLLLGILPLGTDAGWGRDGRVGQHISRCSLPISRSDRRAG